MPVLSTEAHNRLVRAAYLSRGYTDAEATDAVKLCESAARHGIKTHNAIKALHLDDHFGSKTGGCVPGAEIEVLPTRPWKPASNWPRNTAPARWRWTMPSTTSGAAVT
jgi:L-2-hydroxycarboxylate dehydrogenase (NAD+)